MPIYVEMPRGRGVAEFPDNATDDDIMRAVKREMLTEDVAASREIDTRGVFLDELGSQMMGNLQQAGIGVAQGFARLGQAGNKLLELGARHLTPGEADQGLKGAIVEQLGGAADVAGQAVQELEALGAETEGSSLPRTIASGAVSSLPSIAAAPLGLAAAAATAAIQQFGSSYADYEQHYQDTGASEEQARGRAFAPALASGLITGLVTAGYGRTGIEALRNAGPQGFKAALHTVLNQAGLEGMEEFTDEVWQTVVEEVAADPDKTPEEVLGRALTAFSAGLVAGGGMQAVVQASPADAGSQAAESLGEAGAQDLLQTTQTRPEVSVVEPIGDAPAQLILEEAPVPDALDPSTVEAITGDITPPEAPTFKPLDKGEASATTDLSLGIAPDNTTIVRETEPPPALRVEVKEKPRDFTLFNNLNSPQWTFWFGKLGEAARSAWERMALGEFEMRESIARDVDFVVDDVVQRLPKEWRAEGSKAFFELLDGATLEEINARPIGQEVKDLAARVKTQLEDIRVTIRDLKRDKYRTFLEGKTREELIDIYVGNVDPDFDRTLFQRPNLTKAVIAQNIANHFYPDGWGIADGTYIPHMFIGQWKASIQEEGKEGPVTRFVLRGETPEEVQTRLRDFVRANPEAANAKFVVEPSVAIPADVTRLSDKQFFTLMQEMGQKLTLDATEVRDSTRGLIGRKASKQKYWGNLQTRYGAKNYEQDFQRVMTSYLYGFHRWRVLSRVNKETQPLIEQVRREGRGQAANELDDILKQMWGTPAESTLKFDAFLQRIPILKDRVKPLALDRWLRATRSVGATLMLTTPKFAVLNRLQPLQGLYPLIGERLLMRAKVLQHSAEGKRLLSKYGVTFDVGQYGEAPIKGKLTKLRETLTGERTNQELAFLGLYLHGLQTGLEPDSAASYAKLRGQLMTQFTPLISDTPPLMRGPVAATVFQFKRFPIKQLELLTNLVRNRNVPGVVRMLGAFTVLGGLSFYLRSLFTDKDRRLGIKQTLDKEVGTDTADMLFYGLPGLANVDLSGSLILLDEPFGDTFYEKLGRSAVGPVPSSMISTLQALSTEQRAARDKEEQALDALRRIPAFKGFVDLYRAARGNRDVTTADGEIAYRRTLSDLLVNLGSFRSTTESNNRLAIDGITELEKQRTRLKNRLFVQVMGGSDTKELLAEIDAFNQRWPEAAINADEMAQYLQQRAKGINQTDLDRVGKRRYRNLLPEQPQQ